MPIFKVNANYDFHEHSALAQGVADRLLSHKSGCLKHFKPERVLLILECYLQITNRRIEELNSTNTEAIIRKFTESLIAGHFYESTRGNKQNLLNSLCALLTAETGYEDWREHTRASTIQSVPEPLNEEAIEVWSGWFCKETKGRCYSAPLYPVYREHGIHITREIHSAYKSWASSGRHFTKIHSLLPHYLATIETRDLGLVGKAQEIWQGFYEYYVRNRFKAGVSSAWIATLWRNEFLPFLNEHLLVTKVFAKTNVLLPVPRARTIKGRSTNIKTNSAGELVKTKLITHLPLDLPREDIGRFGEQLQSDTNAVKTWAQAQADEIWRKRVSMKCTLENEGNRLPFLNLTEEERQCYKAFHTHGYLPKSEHIGTEYSNINHKFMIATLGIPKRENLLHFCTLLVAEHPKITPSFLANIKIMGPAGEETGYLKNSNVLISIKPRRGRGDAQQEVKLNDSSRQIIERLIELTAPLRDYLFRKNDPAFQYLLLHSGPNACHPIAGIRANSLSLTRHVYQTVASEISKACDLDFDKSLVLASNFSLSALRASVGVCLYMRTGSLTELARALGHKNIDRKLLERYVPFLIREWVQESIIRDFQKTLIATAMQDSPVKLECSGFESQIDFDHHLREHPLNQHLTRQMNEAVEIGSNEILIVATEQTLRTLSELKLNNANGMHDFWANLHEALKAYITRNASTRPDLAELINNITIK